MRFDQKMAREALLDFTDLPEGERDRLLRRLAACVSEEPETSEREAFLEKALSNAIENVAQAELRLAKIRSICAAAMTIRYAGLDARQLADAIVSVLNATPESEG